MTDILQKLSGNEFANILNAHINYQRGKPGGQRAAFTGRDMTGLDLSGLDLAFTDFSGAVLNSVDMSDGNFEGCIFFACDLRNVNFTNAKLRSADFRGAVCSGADLTGADMNMADLRQGKMMVRNAKGEVIESFRSRYSGDPETFNDHESYNTIFSGAKMQNANLLKIKANHADFSETDLSGCNMTAARFNGANLSGTSLRNTKMQDADLTDTDLSNAVIVNTDLKSAETYGSNLDNVLTNAEMGKEFEESQWGKSGRIPNTPSFKPFIREAILFPWILLPRGTEIQITKTSILRC